MSTARARSFVSEVVAFRHAPGGLAHAAETSGAIIALPLVFWLFGDIRVGLLGSLGALIVLYLSGESRRVRARALPWIVGAVALALAAGVLSSQTRFGPLVAMFVVAVGGSFASLCFEVGPPGALIPVLITGASAQLTAPASLGGAGLSPSLTVGMVLLGAAVGYLVVVFPLLVAGVRRRGLLEKRPRRWSFRFSSDERAIFGRLVLGILIATVWSAAGGLHHAAWVLLAVIGVLQKDSDVHLGAVRVAQRLIGTALAAGGVWMLGRWSPDGVVLIAVIAALSFGFAMLLPRNLMLALALVTPMAVLLAASDGATLALEVEARVVDTATGGCIAAVILAAAWARHHVLPARHEQRA